MGKKNIIKKLRESLSEEKNKPFRRWPAQALRALDDEKVVSSIERRFSDGQTLSEIREIGYMPQTGLNHTLFMFSGEMLGIERTGILVMTDGNCGVVGIIERFDPVQPNPLWPPNINSQLETDERQTDMISNADGVPFILREPTISGTVRFRETDLEPFAKRTSSFLRRIGMYASAISDNTTDSSWSTEECTGCAQTNFPNDIQCDRECITVTDTEADDCG